MLACYNVIYGKFIGCDVSRGAALPVLTIRHEGFSPTHPLLLLRKLRALSLGAVPSLLSRPLPLPHPLWRPPRSRSPPRSTALPGLRFRAAAASCPPPLSRQEPISTVGDALSGLPCPGPPAGSRSPALASGAAP